MGRYTKLLSFSTSFTGIYSVFPYNCQIGAKPSRNRALGNEDLREITLVARRPKVKVGTELLRGNKVTGREAHEERGPSKWWPELPMIGPVHLFLSCLPGFLLPFLASAFRQTASAVILTFTVTNKRTENADRIIICICICSSCKF